MSPSSSFASDSTAISTSSSASDPSTTSSYSYATSKIVRTAVAVGVIVLVVSTLVLFFKVSSGIRDRQLLRRQHDITTSFQAEQRANMYEIAAWSDEPGQAPVHLNNGMKKTTRREKREEIKAQKRGGANAYAVHEWEGVAG
ncbi:MAG: hypothetical protein TREMPRED_005905 [Tremellales sp. Tagirdzhanova-0007]|nr:MAG: hypothetical protein TREMPRED_005905 [Tremellales sp. Tagirdzhanova-0007]